jgi:hypothetical protein
MTTIADGVTVEGREPTDAEVAEREVWAAEAEAGERDRLEAETSATNARESAYAKLRKLGLTDAEIATIVTG